MPRWIKFLLALVLGLASGLIYGWLISPVEYVDTTPEILSMDYRADYVLMAAEIYASSLDPEPAARALALLSSLPPAFTAAEALAYAQASGYTQSDILLLQDLTSALQTWQPGVSP
ncbi:MAG: hypothetical protein HY781_09160 [Chloroflexi bacterium]|nr:hypothetical protein [Chloroflexota bacterium]